MTLPHEPTCSREIKCSAHGLRWPCELCDVESAGQAVCSACQKIIDPEVSNQRIRGCEAWLHQEPTYRIQRADQSGLARLDQAVEMQVRVPPAKTAWLARIAALGAHVKVVGGVIRMSNQTGNEAVGLTIRFSGKVSMYLVHPAQTDVWHRFQKYRVLTHEACFDDETIQWKEQDRLESDAITHDSATSKAAQITLNIISWTEITSIHVDFIATAEAASVAPIPAPSDDVARLRARSAPATDEVDASADDLAIERDTVAESDSGILISAASATMHDDSTILVLAELEANGGRRIAEYRELQVLVYDAAGKVWGRAYTNWGEFGRRQSLELEVRSTRVRAAPVRVKLFPTTG